MLFFPVALSIWLAPISAFIICWLMLAMLLRRGARLPIDHPSDRSLHATPMPRVGGVGIMVALAGAGLLLRPTSLWPLIVGALVLAAISLLDDYKSLQVHSRLFAHVVVGVAYVLTLPAMPGSSLIVASLVIIGMTNLYNFMDGADGLAGGMAVIGFGGLGIAAGWANAPELAQLCAVIAGAALAFLMFNFPPAKLFMGDAGSIPLGFLAAAIGIYGIVQAYWPPLLPVMIFSPFILDGGVTLIKRALRGEKIWRAHREHYYQRLVRMRWSHRRLAIAAYALMLLCALAGLSMQWMPAYRTAVVLAWAATFILIFIAIDWRWSRFQHDV